MTGLFTSVLNMSITASFVALAVIAARLLLKRAPRVFSYALWLAVLVRLICPFSINSAFSFLSFLKPNVHPGTGTLEYIPQNIGLMQNPVINIGTGGINDALNSSLPPATPLASANPMQIIMDSAGIVWAAGIAVLLIYTVISYLKLIYSMKTATLVRDNIFETDRITSPFVCGFIKPKILIPTGLSEDELPYILAHERVHIRRLDYLVKPLAFLALIVHWFNPLMWISFALMSKDMEMSCDESVLKQLGNDVRCGYSNSLLSLSIRRSGFILGSPLAFGESDIKSRIQNILNYRKPALWGVALGVVVTAALVWSFTANPKNEKPAAPTTYLGYDIEAMMDNYTPYVGDNSKVVALINAMPWPAGTKRDRVELHTASPPYGITINFIMNDASGIKADGTLSGDAFYRNSVMLFSLIDNVDIINCNITDNSGNYDGASYNLSYMRENAENLFGREILHFADSAEHLKNLIDRLRNVTIDTNIIARSTDQATKAEIENYLEIIMSSPKTSSNPYDYIEAHRNEYDSIVKMGDEALDYLLPQIKKSPQKSLRDYIITALINDLSK